MVHTNGLAGEKSPYLLQHAHNPVDWYAWGDEAFSLARRANKPIFLSVGYSTCHWCHVMERECFEDERIAGIMNEHFVNVKVDREERPDVDAQYMAYVQATTGHGGWPMSVFLTPELKPFFGGTYFPPKDTAGMPGFPRLLSVVAEQWRASADAIRESSSRTVDLLERALQPSAPVGADKLSEAKAKWIHEAYDHFEDNFDEQYGGFGGAPKFPTPVNLVFLLRVSALCRELELAQEGNIFGTDPHRLQRCREALGAPDLAHIRKAGQHAQTMVERTLTAIWRGGIHDHVGLGMHRYAVDRTWHVPHFEKMLYDQAQLLAVYSEAAQLDPSNPIYREAIEDIAAYMANKLRDPRGGFYCAEDADSFPEQGAKEKAEGAFAVWTMAEIEKVLPERELGVFCSHYGIRAEGNVPRSADHQGELAGKNVLVERRTVEETARALSVSEEECRRILQQGREALSSARANRPRPHLDDKILTAWNGLAITGLTAAYQATGDASKLHMAEGAAAFVQTSLTQDDNTLLRTYRDGPGTVGGFASDYAFMIAALLDLHDATLKAQYRDWAVRLQERMDALFWDAEHGGYFSTASGVADIQLRLKDAQDGAEPSANSVALSNLARLHLITDDSRYGEQYGQLLSGLGKQIGDAPFARPALLAAILFDLALPRKMTVLAADAADPLSLEAVRELKRAVDGVYSPFKVFAVQQGDRAAVQLCRGTICQAPVSDPAAAAGLLKD